jgi:hypothetical protein
VVGGRGAHRLPLSQFALRGSDVLYVIALPQHVATREDPAEES